MTTTVEMVEVVITASQRVEYVQYRKIHKALFDKYEALCEQGASDGDFQRAFEHLIDYADVCDSGSLQDLTIQKLGTS